MKSAEEDITRQLYTGSKMNEVMCAYAIESGFKREGDLFKKENTYLYISQYVSAQDIHKMNRILRNEIGNFLELPLEAKKRLFFPIHFVAKTDHWILSNVEISRADDKFTIDRNYFDPAKSRMLRGIDDAVLRISGELFGVKNILNIGARVLIDKGQDENDHFSCGPIACWHFNQRINERELSSGFFPIGAREIREEQEALLAKSFALPNSSSIPILAIAANHNPFLGIAKGENCHYEMACFANKEEANKAMLLAICKSVAKSGLTKEEVINVVRRAKESGGVIHAKTRESGYYVENNPDEIDSKHKIFSNRFFSLCGKIGLYTPREINLKDPRSPLRSMHINESVLAEFVNRENLNLTREENEFFESKESIISRIKDVNVATVRLGR